MRLADNSDALPRNISDHALKISGGEDLMQYSAYTNVGRVRSQNQDCYMVTPFSENVCLFTVCDGMGGASGGETASRTACENFHSNMVDGLKAIAEKEGEHGLKTAGSLRKLMLSAARRANDSVYELSQDDPSLAGMGTTLVSILLIKKTAYIINIGDSRAYYLSDGELTQITKDHSYVQYLVDAGQLAPEEAESHPNKNIITKSVGTGPDLEPDLYMLDTRRTDLLLLCSDGLSNMVKETDMAAILADEDMELSHKAQRLAAVANIHGGSDNITAVIIDPHATQN